MQDSFNLWKGNVNARTALAYDAALALTEAIRREDKPNRQNIIKRLKNPDFRLDFGATGIITFDKNGDRAAPLRDRLFKN